MDPATLKFQQALPFSIFPVSTQLAALHTISQAPKVSDSCTRCGSYLTGTTRVTVVRNHQLSRVITTTCNACGRVHSTPLHKGNSTTFPSRKRKASTFHIGTKNNLLPTNQPSITSNTSGIPSSSDPPINPSKPLSTKANNKQSKLYDMLKRNREKEQKRSIMPETISGGLSAFLTTL